MKNARIAALVALLPLAAAAQGPSATVRPEGRAVRLDAALAEISGLAPAGGPIIYAHTDEEARIYALDAATGKITRTFTLGRPAAAGDFEAIATQGETLYLATSAGVVYEAPLSKDRALGFRAYDAGVGKSCEIEGFAPGAGGVFYFACKRKKERLVVYRWSRGEKAVRAIDMALNGAVPSPEDFRAADLVFDAKTQTLLVLDSAKGAILEVSLEGDAVGYWRLGGDHPQAEGLALLDDGGLLVADEGRPGKGSLGRATLTRYPKRR